MVDLLAAWERHPVAGTVVIALVLAYSLFLFTFLWHTPRGGKS